MTDPAWTIARRELSGGLKGFWIYVACLALGTAAIAASGSVAETFTRGLAEQSRQLLGGDAMFVTAQRRADTQERAFIDRFGRAAEVVSLDVMGAAGDRRRQVDIRAIDGAYPLIGKVGLAASDGDLSDSLKRSSDRWGAAVTQSFLDAFDLSVGDNIELGSVSARVTAIVTDVPDRLGTPGGFGPEAFVALEAFDSAGRLTPGQLFRSRIIIDLDGQADFSDLRRAYADAFPNGGMRLESPEDGVDGLQALLSLLRDFLAVIGIAALVAGGVGVAQATQSFLSTRTSSIAALKALGADSALIRRSYLFQLGLLAAFGAAVGVVIGAATPLLLAGVAGQTIPLPQALGIYPAPLAKAFTLGVLAAGLFALPELGRASATRAASLFQELGQEKLARVPALERNAALLAGTALAAVSILSSARPILTASLLGGALIAWAVFVSAGNALKRAAKTGASLARGLWRLSLSNLAGPGSLAPTIVPALGLGLAILTLVASVQANLLRQIGETAPRNAPSMIFSQIEAEDVTIFDDTLKATGVAVDDGEAFRRAPFLLVRISSLNGAPVQRSRVAESERWVVDGETSVTFLTAQPEDVELTAGRWWPSDYGGPLLVSVEREVAAGLGLSLGDSIGFNVFGRNVSAEVASLRQVDWGTFGIGSNTAFIFSPGTLEAANPSHVAIARVEPDLEEAVISRLGDTLPEVVVFQTRPALAAAAKVFGDISIAVNAVASVVILAGLLVLIGAFAALARQRRAEAAILKTYGAERGTILRLYAGEFAVAGAGGALLGAVLGVAAAYPIVVFAFEADWTWPWMEVGLVSAAAVAVSAAGGAAMGVAALSRPPMEVLRSA
ncbi:MAG: FtsX-like permease family protein [Pseudomonadota bacterium]